MDTEGVSTTSTLANLTAFAIVSVGAWLIWTIATKVAAEKHDRDLRKWREEAGQLLKPCPVCTGRAEVESGEGVYWVSCLRDGCELAGPNAATQLDAKLLWNGLHFYRVSVR